MLFRYEDKIKIVSGIYIISGSMPQTFTTFIKNNF